MPQEKPSDLGLFVIQFDAGQWAALHTLNQVIEKKLPRLSALASDKCVSVEHRLGFSPGVRRLKKMRAAQKKIVPNEPGDVSREAGVPEFAPPTVSERPDD
jgi:hypothetical protein